MTDEQAAELFAVAHRSQLEDACDDANEPEDDPENEEQDTFDDRAGESE